MNWTCNQHCIFCSVGHKLSNDGRAIRWNEIKKDIDFAEERGANIISFSGGEPTIRKDLFKAVEYSKSRGFETIEIQSNGRMLKDWDFAERITKLGVNRVLVSIHAPNAELEDYMTQTKGSFDEKVQGMKNLEKLGVEKRTSTVVTTYNYKVLPELAEFLLGFKKNTKSNHFNFAIPDGYAKQNFDDMVPRMEEAAPFIKKACDILSSGGCAPFLHNLYPCILPGYTRLMSELTSTDTFLIGPDFKTDLQQNRYKYRSKGQECKKCKYDLLCIGPFKEYVKSRGFEEFKPIEGKKIEPGKLSIQEY